MSLDLNWRGEPLPTGRHKLSADAVRKLPARTHRAGDARMRRRDGYEATTVPEVVATARVSRNAFYEFFDDKADCFLAVCDEIGEELLGELLALAAEPDWVQAMREGTRRYLSWWQQRPTIRERLSACRCRRVGERALRQRERQYAAFRAMFAASARAPAQNSPSSGPLNDLVPRVLVLVDHGAGRRRGPRRAGQAADRPLRGDRATGDSAACERRHRRACPASRGLRCAVSNTRLQGRISRM